MTVSRSNDNNAQGPVGSSVADAAARAGASGQNAAATSQPAKPFSIFQLNNRLSRPVERRTTGETVAKYTKALQTDAKASFEASGNPAVANDFRFITIDSDQDQVALSAILVCYFQQNQGKQAVGVYTLVVEGSSTNPLREKRVDNIYGRRVETDITAGDVFDAVMWDRIAGKVKSVYGSTVDVVECGAMVIPVELYAENTGRIHDTFFNAAGALFTIMDVRMGNSQPAFSAEMIERDAQKFAALDYNPRPVTNAVGLPVRSDLAITMTVQKASGNQNDLHERSMMLSRVDGFVDLTYGSPDMVPTGYGQVVQGTQSYYPRYVITKVDTGAADAITPELHLLAISTASMLWTNRAWMANWLPKYDQGEDLARMRDFGAVGYEVNLTGDPNSPPNRIDTTSDSFNVQALQQLIQTTVRDRLIISMDIEERGALSWLSALYIDAADQKPAAVKSLVQSLDNLTNGHFSKIYNSRPNSGQILRNDQNRIELGYWKAKNGELRDIRDFDYLAVQNLLAAQDPKAIVNWSSTFDNLEIPLEMRVEQRAQMLQNLSHMSFRPKGWARRLTWAPEALAALNEGCALCGLVVSPKNISAEFAGAGARAQYDSMGLSYQSNIGPQAMFSYGGDPYRGGYASQPAPFFNHWY